MAKKEKSLGFDDFTASDDFLEEEIEETEEEQEEEQEEDEEQEEEDKPKKPAKKKSKKEEVIEEEEEEDPKKKSKKKVAPKKEEEPEEEEVEEEIEEEESTEEEEEEAEDPAVATKFFEEVEKLTGQEVEVDYKGVSPLSPQGVALREAALKEVVLDTFLGELEHKFPQVYRALEHANNGGDVAELFNQSVSRDYSKIELKDGDENLAKEILKEYYKSRGVKSEEKIKKLIETDEDSSNGLITEAKGALDELRAEQEEERAEILESQKRKAEDQKKRDNLLVTAIDDILEARKLGNFKIVDRAEARQFKEFLISSVRRTGEGKYEFATPIDPQNMEAMLQYQFFQFKKGDLAKIIQQKATTANVEKLRLKVKNEQTKVKKSTGSERTSGFSMKDFEQ